MVYKTDREQDAADHPERAERRYQITQQEPLSRKPRDLKGQTQAVDGCTCIPVSSQADPSQRIVSFFVGSVIMPERYTSKIRKWGVSSIYSSGRVPVVSKNTNPQGARHPGRFE